MSSQVPYLGLPFAFLSTWAHELGHGMGAVITGGHFDHMIITRNFSGLAQTSVLGDLEHAVVIVGGLLGPAIFGALTLIIARRFNQNRLVLYVLAALLLATTIFWAGDGFTRIGTLVLGIIIGLIAARANLFICSISATMIAIAFCLSAVTRLDYFFINQGKINGKNHVSDTGALADIIGGSHLLWAVLLSALSLFILYSAFRFSDVTRR